MINNFGLNINYIFILKPSSLVTHGCCRFSSGIVIRKYVGLIWLLRSFIDSENHLFCRRSWVDADKGSLLGMIPVKGYGITWSFKASTILTSPLGCKNPLWWVIIIRPSWSPSMHFICNSKAFYPNLLKFCPSCHWKLAENEIWEGAEWGCGEGLVQN